MTYREQTLEIIKLVCQDMIDRVDDIVPDVEGVHNIDVNIEIPSLTDDPNVFPEYSISVNGYPARTMCDRILDILKDNDR